MERDPGMRLARVVEARRAQLADRKAHHGRRAEHARVVAEIARFLARLTDAMGEVNDQLAETDVILALADHERRYAAEASVRVCARDSETADAWLDIAVEGDGRVHALIETAGRRRVLAEGEVFAVTRDELVDWLTALLEARYLGEEPRTG